MEKWFADDTYLKKDKEASKPNIYIFGGVMISKENEILLRKKIRAIKAKYTHPNLPIKWNIKDNSVKEIYDKFRKQQEYEKLKITQIFGERKFSRNHYQLIIKYLFLVLRIIKFIRLSKN